MKTADLIGPALDWAVAKCEGFTDFDFWHTGAITTRYENGVTVTHGYSGNWSQGGPIIEREGINWRRGNDLVFPRGNENGDFTEPLWLASIRSGPVAHGRTPLIAAMRCFVAAKLGDEVDVPQELT